MAMRAADQPKTALGGNERILTLSGGMEIGIAEYGALHGVPVIALHGAPSSRLMFSIADEPARQLGMRIIAPDRPGYGLSPPNPRAAGLLAQAEMVRDIADRLALDRFGLIGISGGGPYAAAAAALTGQRVLAMALVSPVGLIAELAATPWLAERDRWFFCRLPKMRRTVRLAAKASAAIFRQAPDLMVVLISRLLGESDRTTLTRSTSRQAVVSMTLEGLRSGIEGGLADMNVFGAPWACDLTRISAPVRLWQGTADLIVPPAASIELSRRIPNCQLALVEGGGHFWVVDHVAEVLGELRHMMLARV